VIRIGLVLGAGGATGWVFHTGVLRTLEAEHGIAATDADVIVGTSAGSAVAAAVRAGVGLDEVLAAVTTPPTPEQQAAMRSELRSARKTLRPLSPRLARHALPGGNGAAVAVAGLLPPGWFPTSWLASFPGMDRLEAWPEGLWIPAVRAADGEVVVFGRDRCDVPVHVAAEASSAVPGMFRPRRIDGVDYVDGGVVSPTHAGLLAGSDIDVAIVSSPMSKPSRRPFARLARRRLSEETAALERAGIATIVVHPSAAAVRDAKGFPRRNPGAARLILEHAAAATRAAFAVA
jgi:NTE family protein